jgi:phosphatidylserine/phosphatidylglycerophosphate/cardiolipin synthase-like enzyme
MNGDKNQGAGLIRRLLYFAEACNTGGPMPKPVTEISRKSILAFLTAAREKQGLGVGTLEKKAGVPTDTIRDFERGKAHLIRADKLQKILNALGYNLAITRLAIAAFAVACFLNAAPAQAAFFHKDASDLGAATVEVDFSPDMGATDLVVKAIGESRKTIRLAAYSFTSKPVAQALLNAHKRGVDVKVVVDKSQAKARYTSATFLANVGIPTRIDYKYAIMHNKFIVIDDVNVETGSFNFTSAAEHKNAENVIVLRNDPAVAKQYAEEWARLWEESETLEPRY